MSLQLKYNDALAAYEAHLRREPAAKGTPEYADWLKALGEKLGAYLRAADDIMQMERRQEEEGAAE